MIYNNLIHENNPYNMSKFVLSRCELYNHKRHNLLNDTNIIDNQIICMDTIDIETYSEYIKQILKSESIRFIASLLNRSEILRIWNINTIPINKNNWLQFCDKMFVLIRDPFYNKINIVEKYVIIDEKGYEWSTCIIKTFWIKLIQRSWKKIFLKRTEIIKKRLIINNLLYWQTTGSWPRDCRYLPTIYDIKI